MLPVRWLRVLGWTDICDRNDLQEPVSSRPLSKPSSDISSQRIWSFRSASRDGGSSPVPSGWSGRSWLTMAARARRSWSLALIGVLIAGPFRC